MNVFFIMEPEKGRIFGTKWVYGRIHDLTTGPGETCPICGGPVSRLKWLPPHQMKLSSSDPGKWGDFVWGAGFPLVVSARFKSIYENNQLTGIQNFSPPITIIQLGRVKANAYQDPLPVYHLIDVSWGGVNQDDTLSMVEHRYPEKIKCSYCRVGVSKRRQKKVMIEDGSWNNDDIFKPRGAPVEYAVSDRFSRIVRQYNLTNCWLIPAEKYSYDDERPGMWFVNDDIAKS